MTQKSENIKDYDRKSHKKIVPQNTNDDLKSQIQVDESTVKVQVDLPPPIQNTFMQSQEHFGNISNTQIDAQNSSMPDQEAS